MFSALSQVVPITLGLLAFVSVFSDPSAPCGVDTDREAETIHEHCRAVANHCREIMQLIIRRTGGNGTA